MCQWSAAEKPKSYLQKYLNAHLSQKSPHSCCVSDSWGQNQQFLGLRFRCSSSVWELLQAYLFCFNFSHLSMSFLRYSWELLYIELRWQEGFPWNQWHLTDVEKHQRIFFPCSVSWNPEQTWWLCFCYQQNFAHVWPALQLIQYHSLSLILPISPCGF